MASKDKFLAEYDAHSNLGDWDVLDEEKWSVYRRLESFRRLVAWWRGESWRGYRNFIGAPILYPKCSQEAIERVVSSPDVQRTIQRIAQVRASGLLACVRDGKVSREYVDAYLSNPNLEEEPFVDPERLTPPLPLKHYLQGKQVPDLPPTQQFYTKMRIELEQELISKTREIIEIGSARLDSCVSTTYTECLLSVFLVLL